MSVQMCDKCGLMCDTDFVPMYANLCESCCFEICNYYDSHLNSTIAEVASVFKLRFVQVKNVLKEYSHG